jgi:hypothetical protein
MAIRTAKNNPWHDPNFEPPEGPTNTDDQFAQFETPGTGLRQFIDRETRLQAASSGSNETLIPGKLYLRQQPSGLWELIWNRGRGCFNCYPSESREDLLEFAKQNFIQES